MTRDRGDRDRGRGEASGRRLAAAYRASSSWTARSVIAINSSSPVPLIASGAYPGRAFRRWYDMTAPRVYAYLYSRTGSASAAEELTQETFIEVVRSPRTFDGRSDALPWVIGIARHRLSRYFRRTKLDDGRSDELVREVEIAGEDTRPWRTIEQRADVVGALGGLPKDQRAALMLRFVDGLSVKAVADTLGRSEDATESLIRRARQSFEAAYRGGQ
jgi:RNA polymerase sigma-70 factor (ECF subfamily)